MKLNDPVNCMQRKVEGKNMYHIEHVIIASASSDHFLKLKSPPSKTWEVTGIKNRK